MNNRNLYNTAARVPITHTQPIRQDNTAAPLHTHSPSGRIT